MHKNKAMQNFEQYSLNGKKRPAPDVFGMVCRAICVEKVKACLEADKKHTKKTTAGGIRTTALNATPLRANSAQTSATTEPYINPSEATVAGTAMNPISEPPPKNRTNIAAKSVIKEWMKTAKKELSLRAVKKREIIFCVSVASALLCADTTTPDATPRDKQQTYKYRQSVPDKKINTVYFSEIYYRAFSHKTSTPCFSKKYMRKADKI